jgi:hypothetical protein
MPMTPSWSEVVTRYRLPTPLRTRARRAGFTVVSVGNMLLVTPHSTGRPRNLTQGDFERSVPLLGRAGRGEVNEASHNSSYVEAILVDFRG